MKTNTTNKRIAWIDIARGIAILAVVAGHSLGNYWPNYLGNFLFAFHMPIFFILSGYLYHEQKHSVLTKKNFFNLLVPYMATVGIEFVLLLFYRIFPNSYIAPSRGGSIREFLIAAIYGAGGNVNIPTTNIKIQPIGAIWFLVAMFIANQIFNAVMKMRVTIYYKTAMVLFLTILGVTTANVFFLPFSIQPALVAQIFLFSGYLIKKYNVIDKINLPIILLFTLLWLWDSTFNLFDFEGVNAANIYLAIIVGITTSIVVIKLSIYIENITIKLNLRVFQSILLFWGSQSLILLCFHLIDLDYVQLWPRVIKEVSSCSNYLTAITIGILYRVMFVSLFAIAMPYIPLLRSFYLHRHYPFITKKVKKLFRK